MKVTYLAGRLRGDTGSPPRSKSQAMIIWKNNRVVWDWVKSELGYNSPTLGHLLRAPRKRPASASACGMSLLYLMWIYLGWTQPGQFTNRQAETKKTHPYGAWRNFGASCLSEVDRVFWLRDWTRKSQLRVASMKTKERTYLLWRVTSYNSFARAYVKAAPY